MWKAWQTTRTEGLDGYRRSGLGGYEGSENVGAGKEKERGGEMVYPESAIRHLYNESSGSHTGEDILWFEDDRKVCFQGRQSPDC